MAHAKTRPDAAPSAAHAAPDPAPAPGTEPAPGSPAAAIHAALTANPGATIAAIADVAGTGKAAARDALLAMEQAGTATRVKAAKPGIPDTWTLADAAQDAGPAAGPEDEQDTQPDGGPGPGETAAGAVQGAAAGTTSPRQPDGDAEDGTSAAADPGTEKPRPHDDAPAGDSHQDADLAEQHDEAVPDSGDPQDPQGSDTPRDQDAVPADGGGEAGAAPDPALVMEITERIGQITPPPAQPPPSWPGAETCAPCWRAWTRSPSRPPRRDSRSRPPSAAGSPGCPARRAARQGAGPPEGPPGRNVHPARDPQGSWQLLRRDRQRPGHPGQARRSRTGHREAAPVPPRRGQARPGRLRGGQRGPRRGRHRGTGGCRLRTPAGRGGSTPPRPRAAKPLQWFVLRPWLSGVTTAAGLLRARPPASRCPSSRGHAPTACSPPPAAARARSA